jgi:hypothetical protein
MRHREDVTTYSKISHHLRPVLAVSADSLQGLTMLGKHLQHLKPRGSGSIHRVTRWNCLTMMIQIKLDNMKLSANGVYAN